MEGAVWGGDDHLPHDLLDRGGGKVLLEAEHVDELGRALGLLEYRFDVLDGLQPVARKASEGCEHVA